MEDVRFYDFDFHLLHIEHDIFSCNWTLYENDIGTFEMHFPTGSKLASLMMEHRYMVAVQGDKQAIITGKQLGIEGILYGRSPNWILTKFCVPSIFNTDTLFAQGELAAQDAQTVCTYLVESRLGGLMVVQPNTEQAFGQVFLENESVSTLFDLVQSVMKQDGGGHGVFFDVENKQWVFTVTKGKKLSAVFSEDNKNAYDMAYSEDLQDFAPGGWYMQRMKDKGEWNASENSPKLVNKASGNFAKGYHVSTGGTRFGITFSKGDYVVCKNKVGTWEKADEIASFPVQIPSEMVGIYAWETPLDGQTETEAIKDLDSKKVCQTMAGKVKDLKFGRDYALGDLIWTEMIKGSCRRSQIKKITGVRLWYEHNDVGEEPMMEEAEE